MSAGSSSSVMVTVTEPNALPPALAVTITVSASSSTLSSLAVMSVVIEVSAA